MDWEGSLSPLFWVLLLVFPVQAIVTRIRWIRIPSILAYIFLGMFLQSSGLLELQDGHAAWLHGMSSLGLFYLMFLSGLEIDLDLLRIRKGANLLRHPVVLGLLAFGGSAGLSYLLGLRMQQIDPSIHAWMMMLILSTTSLGIVMPVLREFGMIRSPYGQTLLTAAFIADLITMLLLSVVSGFYRAGFSWRQASVGLLLPLIVICYQAFVRLRRTRAWRGDGVPEPSFKLQAVFAVLGLYGILTDLTGAEPILGAFLAGLLLAGFRMQEHHPVRQQLEGIGYGFIIPIFFLMVGAQFNLQAFLASPRALEWVPLLLGAAFVVKVLPMAGLFRALGVRMALAGGFLLSSRMTLVVVAASIGIRLGVIPPSLEDALIVVAMLTSLLSPLIFTLGHRTKSA
ncbi:cation:proton antiporter [Cohnella zeiphila]|uniref:Cation:proton antiporter n=1 Tax=Cohnella zeiphila TaxID=2761120 RepID=A0A7X0SPB3_9BACL|nr:cation:proton antiporter [Cohnella zeiphila]MBB6733685.1 cation:proton antiporter [Cohnella zeiphila]